MVHDLSNLSPIAIDCMKELGNIGSSSAANSLSAMLGKTVKMRVPDVRVLEYQQVIDELGGAEKIITGILVPLGGDIKGIRLTAVGAELVLARPLGYWQEGLSALAGPRTNLLFALVCCHVQKGLNFAGLNLVLALFNLLPVGRRDGGRALYCTLTLLAGPDLADRAGRWLDCLCIAGALAAGLCLALFRGNITLLLVAFWLTAVFLRQNIYQFPRNKACQRGRKKVQ